MLTRVKTNAAGFEKDVRSGGVINVDTAGYKSYIKQRNDHLKMQNMEQTIFSLSKIVQYLEKKING